jgi:hypothetical protein
VTELVLFGVLGSNARTLAPGRGQVNLFRSREGWTQWGNEANAPYAPDWPTYKNASGVSDGHFPAPPDSLY